MWGKIDRLLVSLTGAVISIFSLVYDGVTFSTISGFLIGTLDNDFVNLHTILLIFGMLILLGLCQEMGVFSFIAFKLAQKTGGNKYLLFFILCILAYLFSAILNNILTVLLLIPLTITICKILNINPIPYILAQALIVNLGGILFSISSIPNILITQSIDWNPLQFILEVGWFSIILLVITVIFLMGYNSKKLETPNKKLVKILKEYDAWYFVKNKKSFFISLIVLLSTIISFIAIPLFLSLDIDLIAITGGIILIFLLRTDIKTLIKAIDFELLLYLISIFFIIDAFESTGLLLYLSGFLLNITQGNVIFSTLVAIWFSSYLSANIDNAPITKILIPVFNEMTNSFIPADKNTVFAGLAYGVNLGDNITPMGDNVLVIKIVENYGRKITSKEFLKVGFVSSNIQLIAITFYILMRFNFQFLIFGIIALLSIFLIILFVFFHKQIFKITNKLSRKQIKSR
jgi:Na+/H+ antiporter NhaD/arsenite permease-like protein